MGLQNYEGGKYITILGGKFSQRVSEGTVGATTRVNKAGKTVFENYYDSFTGKLVGIKTQDGEYGKNWLFSFKDKEDVYNLQLGYSNGYAVAFLKMLPNIDTSSEMKVSPRSEEKDGKTQTTLFVNQSGKPIKHAYTKENPNGLPQWEQITVKGQLTWDSTKQLEFLENMVMTVVVPKLEGVSVPPTETADQQFDSIGAGNTTLDGEDTPF